MEDANNVHTISEIFNFYHRFAGTNMPPSHEDVVADFQALQDLATELELLRDCFPNPGSITVVLPSSEEPDLGVLHRAITITHFSTYALKYLFRRSVRRFYCNFTLQDVYGISQRKTAKVSLMELLVVLHRMLRCQENNCDYPNIHEDDLPYRSRSWVLNLIEYLESEFISRRCLDDDFVSVNHLVGRVLELIDYYEITLAGNEARFLREHVLHVDK
jgi:hypothetical protein